MKIHRDKLHSLQHTLKEIANNPTTTDDADFENRLELVQKAVNGLHDLAKSNAGSMTYFFF